MLNTQERKIIEQYVDDIFFDRKRLIKYLNMHDVVGNEVFPYCDKHKDGDDRSTYSNWLDDEDGYQPLPVSTFVKRVPFYFYARDKKNTGLEDMGTLHYLYSSSVQDFKDGGRNIESIYLALEYMFYSLKLTLNRIFSYWINQTGQVSGDGFFQWNHYLHLCDDLRITNYFPECFITACNIEYTAVQN